MDKKIPIRFFIITFSWTWVCFLPLVIVGLGFINEYKDLLLKIKEPLMILAVFGPAIGAIFSIYTLNGKNELKKYLSSFLSIKFNWKIWFILFIMLVLNIISWIIPELFGYPRLKTYLPNIYVFPLYWLFNIFFAGGQEEIGWRGYILPKLENKFGYLIGSLILGVIWACWHIPFWFIPGTTQSYVNIFSYVLFTIGFSYLLSWIIELSNGKLLSGVIGHANINSFAVIFPITVMENGSPQIRFWLFSILTFAFGVTVAIIRTLKYKSSSNVI
jgi:membrane protease YdiL (CAAX protease family)